MLLETILCLVLKVNFCLWLGDDLLLGIEVGSPSEKAYILVLLTISLLHLRALCLKIYFGGQRASSGSKVLALHAANCSLLVSNTCGLLRSSRSYLWAQSQEYTLNIIGCAPNLPPQWQTKTPPTVYWNLRHNTVHACNWAKINPQHHVLSLLNTPEWPGKAPKHYWT